MAIELAQGIGKFLDWKLSGIIQEMNEDLMASVVGSHPMKPFTLAKGLPKNPSHPTIAVRAGISDRPKRLATGVKGRCVRCNIYCLIPQAADNTAANFEQAYRVASDHVLSLLDSDTEMLTPKIDAGDIASLTAFEAERGDLMDIFPYLAADKKTMIHGWYVPFDTTFALSTLYSYP